MGLAQSVRMSRRVHTNKALLEVLSRAKPKLRKSILKAVDKDVICTLCEVSHNLLNGAVPLTPPQIAKLSKHKRPLRRLAQRGEGWQKKKDFLEKSGGAFLPALIGALLVALSGGR